MFPHAATLTFAFLALFIPRNDASPDGLPPDLTLELPLPDLAPLVPPTQDPFYTPPANISAYREGQLVRDRLLPGAIKSGPATTYAAGRVYQYMYRSRDSLDRPAANVATLLAPPAAAPRGDGARLLSYAIAYDSPNPDCVPSYALRPGSPAPAGALSVDAMMVSAAVASPFFSFFVFFAALP